LQDVTSENEELRNRLERLTGFFVNFAVGLVMFTMLFFGLVALGLVKVDIANGNIDVTDTSSFWASFAVGTTLILTIAPTMAKLLKW